MLAAVAVPLVVACTAAPPQTASTPREQARASAAFRSALDCVDGVAFTLGFDAARRLERRDQRAGWTLMVRRPAAQHQRDADAHWIGITFELVPDRDSVRLTSIDAVLELLEGSPKARRRDDAHRYTATLRSAPPEMIAPMRTFQERCARLPLAPTRAWLAAQQQGAQ